MTDPILDLIEATATDPAADQTLKDWILESVVPVLCAEVRQIRKESRPVDLVGSMLAAPPIKTATPGPAPIAKPPRVAKRPRTGGKQPGPKVPGLRAAMKRAGMLVPELAAKCGVSEGAVDDWIKGKNGVQAHRMAVLTSVLGCAEANLTRAE